MRKIVISLVLILFTFSLGFITMGIVKKLNNKNQIKEKISKLPSFSFTTLNDTLFNSSSITCGPVLIVRYHPECEHCQYEISELFRSKIPGSGATILLISSADRDSISAFLSQFRDVEAPGIIPLQDTAYLFTEVFGSDIVPSNYIYNKELNLVKVLQGEFKTETILKYLNESE